MKYILIEKFNPKQCSKCNEIFPETNDFFQKDNRRKTFRKDCKSCHKISKKKWFCNNENHRKIYYSEYCIENKISINKTKKTYKNNRRKIDPLYDLTISIRNTITSAIKKGSISKKNKTHEILGCSFEEFKIHIEKQFLPWMSWENHGKYNKEFNFGWDFDHIIPISSAKTEEEIIQLNHYTNFQPLCSKINRDIKKDIAIVNYPD